MICTAIAILSFILFIYISLHKDEYDEILKMSPNDAMFLFATIGIILMVIGIVKF